MRQLPATSGMRMPPQRGRRGFTLVELLVVVAIVLIMAGLTLAVWTSTASADRIRSAARQVQSAILGARDRAIYAPRVASSSAAQYRGLRLIRNADDSGSPETVKSFVLINDEAEMPATPVAMAGEYEALLAAAASFHGETAQLADAKAAAATATARRATARSARPRSRPRCRATSSSCSTSGPAWPGRSPRHLRTGSRWASHPAWTRRSTRRCGR